MINKLMQMGESRQPSNVRRNILDAEESMRKNQIDRTETTFVGASKMTQEDLKEAAKQRRKIADKY